MIQTIAVVGNDIHAWMAAIRLAISAAATDVTVRVITQGAMDSQKPLCLGYQSFKQFLQAANIDEPQFIKQTDASITLANHLVNWHKPNHAFYHATAEYGVRHFTAFHHLAKCLQVKGLLNPFDDYSLGAAAARQEKFRPPSPETGDITASYEYGYQFRADLCCALLRQRFQKIAQCYIHDGPINSVRTASDGCLESVVLRTGEEVHADLFIDSTGVVCGALPDTPGWLDWSAYIPSGHWRDESTTHDYPQPSVTLQRMPDHIRRTLRSRHQNVSEYYFFSDAVPPDGQGITRRLQPGVRLNAWTRNCIALGPALVSVPFLIASDIETTLHILAQLDRLYPHDPTDAVIAREFNRLTGEFLARLRDSQALILHLAEFPWTVEPALPASGTGTRAAPTMLSPELAWKLELYKTFGKMPAYAHEPVDDADWINLLAGMGHWPQRDDMLLQTRPTAELHQLAQHILRLVTHQVERMPTLKQWLAQCCGDAY